MCLASRNFYVPLVAHSLPCYLIGRWTTASVALFIAQEGHWTLKNIQSSPSAVLMVHAAVALGGCQHCAAVPVLRPPSGHRKPRTDQSTDRATGRAPLGS